MDTTPDTRPRIIPWRRRSGRTRNRNPEQREQFTKSLFERGGWKCVYMRLSHKEMEEMKEKNVERPVDEIFQKTLRGDMRTCPHKNEHEKALIIILSQQRLKMGYHHNPLFGTFP